MQHFSSTGIVDLMCIINATPRTQNQLQCSTIFCQYDLQQLLNIGSPSVSERQMGTDVYTMPYKLT